MALKHYGLILIEVILKGQDTAHEDLLYLNTAQYLEVGFLYMLHDFIIVADGCLLAGITLIQSSVTFWVTRTWEDQIHLKPQDLLHGVHFPDSKTFFESLLQSLCPFENMNDLTVYFMVVCLIRTFFNKLSNLLACYKVLYCELD
jgi:hypothetical protein